MRLEDHPDLEGALRTWEDAEPPARLDGAVRRQAYVLLCQRRATREAGSAGAYPAWLLALTAATLVVALALARALPAGRILWDQTCQALRSLPLLPGFRHLMVSNVLAALMAPMILTWRKARGSS